MFSIRRIHKSVYSGYNFKNMRFDVITIFPEIFDSYLNESILKRALKKKLIAVKIWNLRDFSSDKHRKVDDRPYGGGPGMVFKPEPILKAVKKIIPAKNKEGSLIVFFSPAGKQFDNKKAAGFAKRRKRLIFVCDRYEGIDFRVKKIIGDLGFKTITLSVGPYVLTGGEIPAMVVIDAVSRQIAGVLGKKESREEERFGPGLPAYTRPAELVAGRKKYRVPKILVSGNHAAIEKWRQKNVENGGN